jgi:hypothetical protein
VYKVLQNDIPEFDEMLIEAVNSINQESECPEVSVEGNQTASQPSELVDAQHDQPQSKTGRKTKYYTRWM